MTLLSLRQEESSDPVMHKTGEIHVICPSDKNLSFGYLTETSFPSLVLLPLAKPLGLVQKLNPYFSTTVFPTAIGFHCLLLLV